MAANTKYIFVNDSQMATWKTTGDCHAMAKKLNQCPSYVYYVYMFK